MKKANLNDYGDIGLAVENIIRFNEVFQGGSPALQEKTRENTAKLIASFRRANPSAQLKMLEAVRAWTERELNKRPNGPYASHYTNFFNAMKTLHERRKNEPQAVDKCLEIAQEEINSYTI